MAARLTDAQQDSYVTQGLALGVLSHAVAFIPADKLAFEFALSHAWRSFSASGRFSRAMSDRRGDPYYLLGRSERRRGPILAAWEEVEHGWAPYVWNDGWTVDESGLMLSRWTETPWDQWRELAGSFVAYYQDHDML